MLQERRSFLIHTFADHTTPAHNTPLAFNRLRAVDSSRPVWHNDRTEASLLAVVVRLLRLVQRERLDHHLDTLGLNEANRLFTFRRGPDVAANVRRINTD
jgi:hypothetical protein